MPFLEMPVSAGGKRAGARGQWAERRRTRRAKRRGQRTGVHLLEDLVDVRVEGLRALGALGLLAGGRRLRRLRRLLGGSCLGHLSRLEDEVECARGVGGARKVAFGLDGRKAGVSLSAHSSAKFSASSHSPSPRSSVLDAAAHAASMEPASADVGAQGREEAGLKRAESETPAFRPSPPMPLFAPSLCDLAQTRSQFILLQHLKCPARERVRF